MIKDWQSGQTRWISHDMMLLTLRIIGKTMMGVDLQTEVNKIGTSVEQCIRYSAKRLYSTIPVPPAWIILRENVESVELSVSLRIKDGLELLWLKRSCGEPETVAGC